MLGIVCSLKLSVLVLKAIIEAIFIQHHASYIAAKLAPTCVAEGRIRALSRMHVSEEMCMIIKYQPMAIRHTCT